MDMEKIDNIKTIISLRLKELSKRHFDKNIDMDGDESDEVQGAFILNLVYECSDRNNAEIELLNDAMKKINDGEYGLCEECESDIEYRRLMVNPGARYCIKCAELIEKRNKSYRKA